MTIPTADEPKNKRWSFTAALCLVALTSELIGIFMYLQTRYEKEGAIAAAVGCLLFQILTVMCIVFARTRKRKIVSFLFLAVGIAHFAALIIAVAALIGSLSNVGGHMF